MWRGIVVSTTGYYARGPGFESRETQTFFKENYITLLSDLSI